VSVVGVWGKEVANFCVFVSVTELERFVFFG
jgi:hypothetical protein